MVHKGVTSPGCLPNSISNANIPKLYTSHFSVTFVVYASSAKNSIRLDYKEI
jgi:hypothetical protein